MSASSEDHLMSDIDSTPSPSTSVNGNTSHRQQQQKEEEEEDITFNEEDMKTLLIQELNLREQIDLLQQEVAKLSGDRILYVSASTATDDSNQDEQEDDQFDNMQDDQVDLNNTESDNYDEQDDDQDDDEDSDDEDDSSSSQNESDNNDNELDEASDSGKTSEKNDQTMDDDDEEEDETQEFEAPEWCVPIKANVMTFDWESLAKEVQFDVIVADPPWQLATHAPTRGVAIAYQQLPDVCIEDLPIPKLQENGFIFIWVINNKYAKAFEMMEKWGYTYVDDITWVKQTVNRRMAKGHGYYLQHAKETCLVGRKGKDPITCRHSVGSDIIFSERRGQSQKPEELYELIEELVPNGKYLEIFGRKNNLRDYWVTVGNEL